MSWPQEVKPCIAVKAKYILHGFRSLIHAEVLKLCFVLTRTPEGFQSRTSCITCRTIPEALGVFAHLHAQKNTHVHTLLWRTKLKQCLCPTNYHSLWYRDKTSAKHYNHQAKEFTASPRITTAEKCLSLPISMSSTLTSSLSSSPTLPSATFFPVFCPRFRDLYECMQENYSQFARKGCSTKKVG